MKPLLTAIALIALIAIPVTAQSFPLTNAAPYPDGAGTCLPGAPLTLTINVPAGTGTITGLTFSMCASHTWFGDVQLDITSPMGTTVAALANGCLSAINDDSSNLDGLYVLDDTAATTLDAAAVALPGTDDVVPSGTYGPENPLSMFNGEIADGAWVITFTDHFGPADTGAVSAISLNLNGAASVLMGWELNDAAASLDFNGVESSVCASAVANATPGENVTINIVPGATGIYDLAYRIGLSGAPNSLAMSFVTTGNGQNVDMDIAAPGLLFLSTGGGVTIPGPLGTISAGFPAPPAGLSIIGQMYVVDPANPDGFSLSQAAELATVPCGNAADFETLAIGPANYDAGWDGGDSVVTGTVDWSVNSGATGSAGTGPSAASTGANYLYCETSGLNTAATFVVETCDIDISASAAPMLTLDFNANGATIGTLVVEEITPGGGAPLGAPISIHAGGDLTDIWNAFATPVTPGATVRLRFTYVAGGNFTGDMAIDNLVVQ